MDLEMNKKVYKKKKINPFYIAVWFLAFSILLTSILYIYNMSLVSENKDLDNNIEIKENSITDLEKNPKIVASSLYNTNLSSINKLEDYSRLSTYVNHLSDLRRKYNIDFKWFKYSNWKLTTQATSKSDWYWINYKKVVRFIEEYRLNNDLTSLFDLELVKNISSKDNWALNVFTINLVLKNNISNIFKKMEEKKLELEEKKKITENKRLEELRKKREILLKKAKENNKNSSFSWSTNTWTTTAWAVVQ